MSGAQSSGDSTLNASSVLFCCLHLSWSYFLTTHRFKPRLRIHSEFRASVINSNSWTSWIITIMAFRLKSLNAKRSGAHPYSFSRYPCWENSTCVALLDDACQVTSFKTFYAISVLVAISKHPILKNSDCIWIAGSLRDELDGKRMGWRVKRPEFEARQSAPC